MKKTQTLFLILFLFQGYASLFAQTSTQTGGTFTNAGAGDDWTNMTNTTASNDAYATAVAAVLGNSKFMEVTNLGFAIPGGSTIDGIEMNMERSATITLGVNDNDIRIIKGGTRVGTNHASGTGWPDADATITYGNSTDLWGTTWTPAEINASDFGVGISVAFLQTAIPAQVDYVEMVVHYTGPLDVQLADFTAEKASQTIRIGWTSTQEIAHDYYEVQRSTFTEAWTSLTEVKGIGNSFEPQSYEYVDNQPKLGENLYRLKMVDVSGEFTYSPSVSINTAENLVGDYELIYEYGKSELSLIRVTNDSKKMKVSLLDLQGKSKLVANPQLKAGEVYTMPFEGLSPGYYFLLVKFDQKLKTHLVFVP